ncbi:MAG: bile acid:sodium symporter family protein [Lewinellaceae bacterium]|nr:bile acid:sodium symporter family protein [Lewinellaceae bacterium]
MQFRLISFSLWVLLAALAALFYPALFSHIGQFSLQRLIIPLLQVIMFGMGTAMSIQDFRGVIRTPRPVITGLLCQFSIMPLVGWSLAAGFGFPPEIAAGIILVGCSPSGLASNVMSFLARANVALSVTLTAVATALAPLMTPLLMRLLGGAYVEVDLATMMLSMVKIVVLPIAAGLMVNRIFRRHLALINQLMPRVSMIGIALVIAIITASGRDNLLAIGAPLILACLLHNVAGYFLGFGVARLLRLSPADCRTIAIEVGMQNSGLASGLALEMGKVATMGLAPIVFGPLMNMTGSALAGYWREKPLAEKPTS